MGSNGSRFNLIGIRRLSTRIRVPSKKGFGTLRLGLSARKKDEFELQKSITQIVRMLEIYTQRGRLHK